MLAAGSVQEAHDFALVAHAATLRSRVPFLHFFDGFRTSHEINKIAVLDDDDIRALVRDDDVLAFRARGMTPDAPGRPRHGAEPRRLLPGARGLQPVPPRRARDRPARSWTSSPTRTGRRYGLVDYHGAPDADRVIIVMGSAAGARRGDGRRRSSRPASGSGCCDVRLFQPFPAEQLVAALPPTRAGDRGARPDEGAGRRRRAALPRGRRGAGRGDGRRRAAVRDRRRGSSAAATACRRRR